MFGSERGGGHEKRNDKSVVKRGGSVHDDTDDDDDVQRNICTDDCLWHSFRTGPICTEHASK